MAAVAKPQTPVLLGVTPTTGYTVGAATVGNLKELIFCNTTGSDASVTTWMVPVSGSVSSTNMVINAVVVASGTTVRFPWNTFLEGGATVQAQATVANRISMRCSAVEFS